MSIRTVAIAGSPSSFHPDPITRTRGTPEGHAWPDRGRAETAGTARERQATSPLMGHDDTANVMLDKRQGEDLLLGVLYAALGAFTFALNNVMMRRGVVTGSVLQGMALTVPIGGLSFLVITIASGEVGQLVVFPTAAFAWLACQGVVHFVIGR